MQKKALIMLAVAITMGFAAVFLVNSLMQKESGPSGEGGKSVATRTVVVAAVDLDVGTRLDRAMLKTVDWPDASVPEGAYADIDAIIGDKPPVILRETRKGEVVLPYKLSEQGARAGLTTRIPVEQRAITVPVNEIRGVAGFILPGDHVDVLYTAAGQGGKGALVTRILLQNVLVLGVDQSSSDKEDKPKVVNAVTLLVSPKQAQMLALASNMGTLTMTLRNEADVADTQAGAVSVTDITGGPVRKTPRVAGIRTSGSYSTVTVIRGSSISNERVKNAAPSQAAKTTSETVR